jgi:hypothetical protein
MVVLLMGGIALAQCEPDSHNDATTALAIDLDETVSDYVCPDDSFDYYYFEVAPGADIAGTITFDAPQTGTVIRIASGSSGTLFEGSTTDADRSLTFTVESGDLSAETYYIRVSHWSAYSYDHSYTITMSLSMPEQPDCVPDGNNEQENASEISFGESISDWVCGDDHIDIYHFTVSTEREGHGSISLTCDPGELKLYLYNSFEMELYSGTTSGRTLQYDLGTSESPLSNGEYYIGVFLPLARSDENSYTLGLAQGGLVLSGLPVITVFKTFEPEEEEEQGMIKVVEEEGMVLVEEEQGMVKLDQSPLSRLKSLITFPETPWRSIRGGPMNTGHSYFNGPQDYIHSSRHKVFEADIDELRSGEEEYKWLLIGPGNRAVFMRSSNTNFVVYNLDTEEVEEYVAFFSPSPKPPAFDSQGHFYCTSYRGFLKCYKKFDPTQETLPLEWKVTLPGDGEDMAIEAVGVKVITSCYDGGWYIYAFNKDGTAAWDYGPLDDAIVGVAEDSAGPVWVQTMRSVYRFNEDGSLDWTRELSMQGRELTHDVYLPIIKRDKWAHIFHQLTDYAYIYHPDGYYLSPDCYFDLLPKVICAGQDGKKYLVNGWNRLDCYNIYWSNIVWCRHIPGEVKDMIQGFDNRTYVVYTRTSEEGGNVLEFQIFDPEGELVVTQFVDTIPQEVHDLDLPVEMAMGEDNKLVILHHGGYLYVYS